MADGLGAAFDNTPPVAATPINGAAFDDTAPAQARVFNVIELVAEAVYETNLNLAVTLDGVVKDGVTLAPGMQAVLTAQTTASQNGVYDVVVSPGVPIRNPTFDQAVELEGGCKVLVTGGTQDGRRFVLSTPPPIVVGTTALTFVEDKAVARALT